MSNSVPYTMPNSQSEIMIRNLRAAGFSPEDIHYEMDGYGCVRTFACLLGDEQAAGASDPQPFSNGE
jgi:hypothetical protein